MYLHAKHEKRRTYHPFAMEKIPAQEETQQMGRSISSCDGVTRSDRSKGWLSVASGIGSVGVFRSRAHRSLVNNPRKGRHYKPVISRVSGPLVCKAGPP